VNSSSFAPASAPDAKLLVLGTLPSQESLRRREYYAHSRNAFWRIVEVIFGIPAGAPYAERVRLLNEAGIALWDVCAAAHRPGSLDSAIRSETPNDFARFLEAHPRVRLIAFNGAKAADLFRKHVALAVDIPCVDLPSTSPAHAAMPFSEKVKRWSIIGPG